MTVTPEPIRWRVIVGLKQPNRKIRITGTLTDNEAGDLKQMMESQSWTTLSGPIAGGNFIVIPSSNVAYVELVRA